MTKKKLFAFLLIFFLVSVLVLSDDASLRQSSALTTPAGGDWTSFTFDYNNSRYQSSSTITSSNVGSIQEAWFFPANHSVTSTPIVQNGHVYISDYGGNVYSLNINTGSDEGSGDWDTNLTKVLGLTTLFAISSTPAVANGLLYVAGSPLDYTIVVALNQTTGAEVWATKLRSTAGGIYSSPIIYKGLVYVGVSDCFEVLASCSERTTSVVGQMFALNAASGAKVWSFTTGNDSKNGGWGGGVWGSVVVDPILNAIYFDTGNTFINTPLTCKTCSLYAYSILSLDASTGKLNWYYQIFKNHQQGDDSDFGSTPNLFSIVKNGITHQAIGVGNKNGYYYILNRQNGKLLYKPQIKKSPEGIIGLAGFVYAGPGNPEIFVPSRNVTSTTIQGEVEAFEPSKTLSPQWEFRTSGQIDGSVALILGAVLVGDSSGYLYAISMSGGTAIYDKLLPNLKTDYGIFGSVTAAEGYILVGDYLGGENNQSTSPNSAGLFAFSLPS
jgi:glucose dehydrogenase